MLTYKGGDKVGKGMYWDVSNGTRIDVAGEEILGGDRTATYYRMPLSLVLLAVPVIGLLYVLLLPFLGIATVGLLLIRKVAGGLLSLIGKSLSFGWRPKEAYLSGKKKQSRKDEK